MTALDTLSPVCMIPRRRSLAIEPLEFLQKIAAIEINRTVARDGIVYFVLDVYLQHFTSRIPTNQKTAAALRSSGKGQQRRAKPDYQIEKRFSDFAAFRYSVWLQAQKNHGCKCAYCDEFMDYIVYRMAQPRLLVRLATTVNTRKKLFATFSNEFVRLAVKDEQLQRPQGSQCAGFQAIPSLVERFFREQDV
ncbi:hypothetical protein PybrP1_006450 [[Pythium] brassicae (nom. inval.)]|nr:hypothetical protein PybrP1_006450 [[Pythium] brassicae (nom. inval.)]